MSKRSILRMRIRKEICNLGCRRFTVAEDMLNNIKEGKRKASKYSVTLNEYDIMLEVVVNQKRHRKNYLQSGWCRLLHSLMSNTLTCHVYKNMSHDDTRGLCWERIQAANSA